MDYKELFNEWAASKPDEQISYATAFQLLDFVEWLNKRASQQGAQSDGACEHVWQASPLVGVDAVCAICRTKSPRRTEAS